MFTHDKQKPTCALFGAHVADMDAADGGAAGAPAASAAAADNHTDAAPADDTRKGATPTKATSSTVDISHVKEPEVARIHAR